MLGDIYGDDEHPFGGIPAGLGGDFAQILPVVRNGNRSMIVNACIQWSFLWPQLQQLTLRQNMWIRVGKETSSLQTRLALYHMICPCATGFRYHLVLLSFTLWRTFAATFSLDSSWNSHV